MEGSVLPVGEVWERLAAAARWRRSSCAKVTGVRDPSYICTTKQGGSSQGPAQDSSP
jgi:hypothetical protein